MFFIVIHYFTEYKAVVRFMRAKRVTVRLQITCPMGSD